MSSEKPPKTFADEARFRMKIGLVAGLGSIAYGLYKAEWVMHAVGAILLLEALLMHLRMKAGIILSFALFVCMAGLMSWLIATQGATFMWFLILGVSLFSLWGEWLNFGRLLMGKAEWNDVADPEEQEDESPMISIVLFQRHRRFLDAESLSGIVQSAWGGEFESEEGEEFVVGEDILFFIKSHDAAWLVHNHAEPYANPEEMAANLPELRLKQAVLDHRAWLSVDLMRPTNEDLPLDSFYSKIFQLILSLADEDTLVMFRPETGQVKVWDEEVASTLEQGDPHGVFSSSGNVPVVSVDGDDPRMISAVNEAREQFGVFRNHWENKKEDDHFAAKAPITRGGNTEFIWMDVTGLSAERIHGVLANDPVNLDGLRLGSQVDVPIEELNDWVVVPADSEDPIGLFSLKAINEIRGEREA